MRESLRLWTLGTGLSVVLALAAGIAVAQDATTEPPVIRASGHATVTAQPDRVELDLGVVTQASDAETAGRENARKLEAALAALRAALPAEAEIQTISYSLTPDYRYPPGGKPEIRGYSATNVVRVETDALERVGKVIDAATAAGANRVQRLHFALSDETAVRSRALALAAKRARAQADAIAGALDLRIVRVLRAEASGAPAPVFAQPRMMAAEAAPTTPVEPGGIDVRAGVTLTLEVVGP